MDLAVRGWAGREGRPASAELLGLGVQADASTTTRAAARGANDESAIDSPRVRKGRPEV